MTYDALRRGRVSVPGQIYLLTTVTAGRTRCFDDFHLARLTIAEMRRLDAEGLLSSLAWVLMPDHLHWLVQLGGTASLSDTVKTFKARVGRRLNAAGGHRGSVWQKGFHDRALRKDEDLPTAARYIVANPLRAGLVQRIGDYPHWDAIWL